MKQSYIYLFLVFAILSIVSIAGCNNQQKVESSNNVLTKQELTALASQFDDEPFSGGQKAPRISKWVNNNTFIFLQFDKSNATAATAVRYVGIGVNGKFCKSSQPNPDFTHFHRPNVANYGEGHGGNPGDDGFWLMWVAVDEFDSGGRNIVPGVDEKFSPTPPPDC